MTTCWCSERVILPSFVVLMSLRSSTKSKCSTCEILYEQLLDVSHGEERRYFSSLIHSIEVALLENIDIIAPITPDEICELFSSQWY